MKKNVTRTLLALALIAVAGLGIVAIAQVAGNHDADRQQLLAMKDAYEQALNNDDLKLLAAHVDTDFSGTMATGAQIHSIAEMQKHWEQLKGLVGIGKGGSYHVTVKPVPMGTMFVSDVAVSFGTTDEKLVLAREPNKTYEFSCSWVAVSRNRAGTWKLAAMHTSMLNPMNTFSPKQMEAVSKLVAELNAAPKAGGEQKN